MNQYNPKDYDPTPCGTAREVGITRNSNNVFYQLEELDKTVQMLLERLAPISIATGPVDTARSVSGGATPTPSTSQLAVQLSNFASKIDEIRKKLATQIAILDI